MSDLVDFEDLKMLDKGDLRIVFEQTPEPRLVEALATAPVGLRNSLMAKLSSVFAGRLEENLRAQHPVSLETGQSAQREIVAAMLLLGHNGLIAFVDPEDMVA